MTSSRRIESRPVAAILQTCRGTGMAWIPNVFDIGRYHPPELSKVV